jgi:hypothetical protein
LNASPLFASASNTFLFVGNHPFIGIDRVLNYVLDRFVVITIFCIIWFCTFSTSCRSFLMNLLPFLDRLWSVCWYLCCHSVGTRTHLLATKWCPSSCSDFSSYHDNSKKQV